LALLRIDDWMQNEKQSSGGRVGGAGTQRIHGDLDVVSAVNDLLDMAGQLGAGRLSAAPRFDGASADQLERATRSATIDVFTGSKDHLLRKLVIHIQFGASPPPPLQSLAGTVGGARLSFEFEV